MSKDLMIIPGWSWIDSVNIDVFRKVRRIRELHMLSRHHNESQCAQNFLWTLLPWAIIRFPSWRDHGGLNSGTKVTKYDMNIRNSNLVTWTPEGPPAGATWRRVLRTIYILVNI